MVGVGVLGKVIQRPFVTGLPEWSGFCQLAPLTTRLAEGAEHLQDLGEAMGFCPCSAASEKCPPTAPSVVSRDKERSGSCRVGEGASGLACLRTGSLSPPFPCPRSPPATSSSSHAWGWLYGFECPVTLFGCRSTRPPPCFLGELSSALRKGLALLRVKLERKIRRVHTPPISSGGRSQRFCSVCPVPIKTGISPVSLILTRRPIEFQPGICRGP